MPYDSVPSKCSLKLEPFKAHVTDLQLEGFKFLLRVSPIGPKTYENQVADVNDYTSFGVTHKWLVDAKQYWMDKYDWRKTEARFNKYNQWTTHIDYEGFDYNIHFLGLFSKNKDAVPLLLLHGWPGSFIEFLDVLDEFQNKYDENSLPFHIVVPSLPGYAYSNGPPLDRNTTTEDGAKVMDKLMKGLGFADGYVSQGGDIGSFMTRIIAVVSDSCKAAHSKSME
jgi:microsomal epoxide hydrolase